MQRIYPCELTVEQYVASEVQRQVIAEPVCPRCRLARGLRRHGSYGRWVTSEIGVAVLILVARFLCSGCHRTVSYLPSFALSYRVIGAATFEAFLNGDRRALAVRRWEELLRSYERRMHAFHREFLRVVGRGFGRAPPGGKAFWPWLKEACGSVAAATRRLVKHFKITVFRSYQCHQPTRAL
jgi:transposase-like protein